MTKLPDPSLPWSIPMEAVGLIAEFEGCRLKAYKCPAGVWTCGWGETDGITPRTVWDQAYADRRFCDSVNQFAERVLALCTLEPSGNQLGGMTSLAYNIGLAAFAKSSVLKAHNRGDFAAAARAFALWNKARVNGVLTALNGLTRRRSAESALYLKPDDGVQEAMPQAVDEESKISKSPIAASGAGAVGVGALALVEQVGGNVSTIATTAQTAKSIATDTLGIPTEYVLPLALVVVGGLAWYWRAKQRNQGWA